MAIVNAFGSFDGVGKARAEHLWKKFGNKTIKNMQSGAHLLAVLWESAWALGDGEHKVTSTRALKKDEAMDICAAPDFVPSVTIGKIGSLLETADLIGPMSGVDRSAAPAIQHFQELVDLDLAVALVPPWKASATQCCR